MLCAYFFMVRCTKQSGFDFFICHLQSVHSAASSSNNFVTTHDILQAAAVIYTQLSCFNHGNYCWQQHSIPLGQFMMASKSRLTRLLSWLRRSFWMKWAQLLGDSKWSFSLKTLLIETGKAKTRADENKISSHISTINVWSTWNKNNLKK